MGTQYLREGEVYSKIYNANRRVREGGGGLD